MSHPVDPRLALLRALNTPPYDLAAGKTSTPLDEAVQLIDAHEAAVLRKAALRLYTALFPAVYSDSGQKAAEGVNRAVTELRRMADETQGPGAVAHSCPNCEGVDPDTCFTNPDRPPDQCSESEFDGYGLQCQKPAGHNLCTFEEG